MSNDKREELNQTLPLSETGLVSMRERQSAGGPEQGRPALIVYYRDGIRVVPLVEGESIVIGRTHPADVPIRDNTLSRQHACVELIDGAVWVEDLGSTNGTWVDGEQADRCVVKPGSTLALGAVTAALQVLGEGAGNQFGLESHDSFLQGLDAEVQRARAFDRTLALLMVRAARRREGQLSRWYPGVQKLLRPFDRVALYSTEMVEILLPEGTEETAPALARKIADGDDHLLCGVALLSAHTRSADQLLEVARTAVQRASSREPVECATGGGPGSQLSAADGSDSEPVAVSEAMQKVFATAERVASSSIPILIQGETGTGKELVAQAIHDSGKRTGNPYVPVNCGAIPAQLVESTLFGHERGAFTGADKQKAGLFEAAAGGTIFLDEIGELPAAAQAALLRVLETKQIVRVGSTTEIAMDARVVAATHRDLEAMCGSGEFRRDLFYRLDAMALRIPPLRDRPADIAPLVERFVRQANAANDCDVQGVADDAMALLRRYRWEGNVRELRNAVERAVVLAGDDLVGIEDLPARVRSLAGNVVVPPAAVEVDVVGAEIEEINLKAELGRYEAQLILEALRRAEWDRKRAAGSLGVPLRTLSHKMQVHGIKRVAYEKVEPG